MPSYYYVVLVQPFCQWDQRLFTLDPVSLAHVLKHSTIYEKPWQSRALISGLIGVGMLAAEGQVHKRQRRVGTPAFSIQNMRALVPVAFKKGVELRNRWMSLIKEAQAEEGKGDALGLWRYRVSVGVNVLTLRSWVTSIRRGGEDGLLVAEIE